MSLVLLAFVQFLQFHSSVFKLHFFFGVFIYSDRQECHKYASWMGSGEQTAESPEQNHPRRKQGTQQPPLAQLSHRRCLAGWGVRGRQEGHLSEDFGNSKMVQ